jgi:hypothetical protein
MKCRYGGKKSFVLLLQFMCCTLMWEPAVLDSAYMYSILYILDVVKFQQHFSNS